jgi:hypothetical protein
MKSFQAHALLFVFSLSACSTATLNASRRPIDLATLERLPPGRTTVRELKSTLGDPAETIATSAEEESWVYNEPHGESDWQRASFTVDRKSGIILTSILVLNETDQINTLDQAIRYFSGSSFVIKDEGWINSHWYSDNVFYSDPVHGIAMTVRKSHKDVSDIGFFMPSTERVPIAAQKKSL